MSILFEYCAFTAFGRCRVVNEQGDNRLVQLENKDTRLWLHKYDVLSVDNEILRRQLIAKTDVLAEAISLCDAVKAGEFEEGHFPDMSQYDLPSDERLCTSLPKGLRDLQEKGVYRPEDLPRPLEQHFKQEAQRVYRCARWAQRIHRRIVPLLIGAGQGVPENVRFIDTGKRNPAAEEAGGFMGYTRLPAPADLSIIPLEFFWPHTPEARRKKVKLIKGEAWIEIGNCRLLIGLSMWPGVLFPDIHFLTETKSEQLPLSPCSA